MAEDGNVAENVNENAAKEVKDDAVPKLSDDAPSTSYSTAPDGADVKSEPARKPRARRKVAGAFTQATFDELSAEEKANVAMLATRELLQKHFATVGNEQVSLWDLGVAVELTKLSLETGLGRSTVVNPRDEIEQRPGWMMRQGAHKMQLRPEEEAALELELLGRGHKVSQSGFLQRAPLLKDLPYFVPQRDFSYGVFCKPKVLRKYFADMYANRDPLEVLKRDVFYQDVILHAPTLELTTMLVVTKDLAVDTLAADLGESLRDTMENLQFEGLDEKGEQAFVRYPVTPRDSLELKQMASLFTPEALGQYPITTANCKKVLKGTTFYFSANPLGGVAVEVQRPGTLREQQQFLMAEFESPALTYAVFDLFLGHKAIDPVAKIDIGACVLYFANGFTMEDDPNNPHQWRPGDELKGAQVEVLQGTPDRFTLPALPVQGEGRPRSNLLVRGIRQRRALRRAREELRFRDEEGGRLLARQ